MKSVVFLLPGVSGCPVGGVKVVVEYANRLAENGYFVYLAYGATFDFKSSSIIEKLHQIARYIYFFINKRYSVRSWIYLNPKVKELWTKSLCERHVPKGDVYVATAVKTAVYLSSYKTEGIKRLYLIQDYESWTPGITEELIWESFRYPMTKIVISSWLEKLLNNNGINCIRIPNGFDFNYFKFYNPIEKRNKYTVAMLYHRLERKGISDGLKALNIVKEVYPDLSVKLFGTCKRPLDLPAWYEYTQQPGRDEHNAIYNEAAIFIGTSHSEGWGLTIGEAMICGCAVICTDNLGYSEMAINNKTAVVVPVKSPQIMAKAIITMIQDDEKRFCIAYGGNKYIQSFRWEKSFDLFKKLL